MTMKKMYALFALTLLFTLLLMNSCTEAIIPEDEATVITETVTYDEHIQSIVFNSCLTCHGSVNPSANLSLTTYSQVKNATQNGTLIQRINDASNPMPQSGLMSAEQRAYFDKWVTDGYLEN